MSLRDRGTSKSASNKKVTKRAKSKTSAKKRVAEAGASDTTKPSDQTQSVEDMATPETLNATTSSSKGAKQVPDQNAVLGAAIRLMLLSEEHQTMFLQDLNWSLRPPMQLNQFRLYTREGEPVALATWAYVADDVDERLRIGLGGRLRPNEWRCGPIPWLMDLICQAELRDSLLAELGPIISQTHAVWALRRTDDGQSLEVKEI